MKKNNTPTIAALALVCIIFLFVAADGPSLISGAITGTADVTIVAALSINFVTNQDSVTFGSGIVESACENATLATNDTTQDPTNCWTGTYPYNDTNNTFEIENDGTVNATVDVNGTNASAFLGGGNGTTPDPEFQFYGADSEGGSCADNLTTTWTDINVTQQTLCDNLRFGGANDQIYTHIRVVIPEDALIGTRNATVEFTAS